MRVFSLLAIVCLFVVGVHGVAQRLSLSGITAGTVSVTTSSPASASNWALTVVSAPTTYASASGADPFAMSFNVTFTGSLAEEVAVLVSFSGAGQLFSIDDFTSCPVQNALSLSFPSQTGSTWAYFDSTEPLYFTANGAYTTTAKLLSFSGAQLAQATFNFQVTSSYTPTTADRPSVTQFTLAGAQSSLPPKLNVTLNSNAPDRIDVYFLPVSAPVGVVYRTHCSPTNGVCGSDSWSAFQSYTGGFCGNSWVSLTSAGTDFQQDIDFVVRAVRVSTFGRYVRQLGVDALTGNIGLRLTAGGSTDHTPPTCTGLTFASTSINTDTNAYALGVTTACTDNAGGSGLSATGVILRLTDSSTGQTRDFSGEPVLTATDVTAYVPSHISGTISVVGLYAIDNAGNAVVYGSCIANDYQFGSLCGEVGSSSASALAASVLAVMLIVVLGMML